MTFPSIKSGRSYCVISDVHISPVYRTSKRIIENLTTAFQGFSGSSPLAQLDAIFFAGDLFDDLIEFGSEVFSEFLPWFDGLLRFCARHEIALRVMEGTPRHDRKGARTLEQIATMSTSGANFRYVARLEIEYLPGLDMQVLYIPDEWRHTAKETEGDVEEALRAANLTQVDIAIMHGIFNYQLGMMPKTPKVHDEAFYLEKVQHYISIGHVHSHSSYQNRIVAQGSFDRLAHGEEAPKGYVLFSEDVLGDWQFHFIENPNAMLYKTIRVKGETLEKALSEVEKLAASLPPNSALRVVATGSHPIFQSFSVLEKKYPFLHFSKKKETEQDKSENTPTLPRDYVPIVLNERTLIPALQAAVEETQRLTPERSQLLTQILEDIHGRC